MSFLFYKNVMNNFKLLSKLNSYDHSYVAVLHLFQPETLNFLLKLLNYLCTFTHTIIINMIHLPTYNAVPASVALSVASRYALLGYGDRRVRVRGPGWPDHCVRL